MTLASAVVGLVLFVLLLHRLKIVPRTQEVVLVAKNSMLVLRNAGIHDRAKEEALQRNAIRLIWLLACLTAGSVVSLGVPAALIWLLDAADLVSLDAVFHLLVRWDFVIAVSVVGTVAYFALERVRS